MRTILLRSLAIAAVALLLCGVGAAAPAAAREIVRFSGYSPGTIVVRTDERRLYLMLDAGHALRYPVGVGKAGRQWSGSANIDGMYIRPAWSPPAVIRRDRPSLPDLIPGGSPRNPMGARAIVLERNEVAIHGTTNRMRASIGTAASYGCIRMRNEDVSDLYNRVGVGTPVIMEP